MSDAIMNDFSAEAQQVIIHLALGLLRQDNVAQRGEALPVTILDEQIQWGWDKLAVLCIRMGIQPPRHIPELITWLHKPVEEWDGLGPLFHAQQLQGYLLVEGYPGDLCGEVTQHISPDSNLEREMQDNAFKQIMVYCHEKYKPEQYILARQFLVEHPYLEFGGIEVNKLIELDEPIRKFLIQAYEPIPGLCKNTRISPDKPVALCPRCNWPLEWRDPNKEQASCYSDLCKRAYKGFPEPLQWRPMHPESMRTKRGIQSSVVGPEVSLIQIYRQLLDWGLQCRLWPELDSYDLLVCFEDGERWAIDMKDTDSPTRLALEAQPFRTYPEWNRAFFVFPEHRRDADYMRAFRKQWSRPAGTEAIFAQDFLNQVQKRLEI